MKKAFRDVIPQSVVTEESIELGDTSITVNNYKDGRKIGHSVQVFSVDRPASLPFFPAKFGACDIVALVENELDSILLSHAGIPAIAGPIDDDVAAAVKHFSAVAIVVPAFAERSHSRISAKLAALRSHAPDMPVAYVLCDTDHPEKRAPVGLVEWLTNRGNAYVSESIRNAVKAQQKAIQEVKKGGFFGAGRNGSSYMLVDGVSNELRTISSNSLKHKVDLDGILGASYMRAFFPGINAGVDCVAAAEHVIEMASKPGRFDESRVRGAGVWRDGESIVVNTGSAVFDSKTGAPVSRSGQFIYVDNATLKFEASAQPSVTSDGSTLVSLLSSWEFESRAHILRLVGHLGLSYIAGALEFKTHGFIYGENGAGKTKLLSVLSELMCLEHHLTSTSPAGLRSALNYSSRCVLIDEQEPDAEVLSRNIEFLRRCSSGTSEVMSDPEFRKHHFRTSCSALIAGTTVPEMPNNADSVRFMLYPLGRLEPKQIPPELQGDYCKKMGPRFAARMFQNIEKFEQSCEIFRDFVGAKSARAAQVISPILAAAWTLLNDDLPDKSQAKAFADDMESTDVVERIDEATDGEQIRDFILNFVCFDKNNKLFGKNTANIIEIAQGDGDRAAVARDWLTNNGIRLKDNEIWLFGAKMKAFFRNTKFEKADMSEKLTAISGTQKSQKSGLGKQRCGGTGSYFVHLPLTNFLK